ncbi:SWIRM domain-containing protein [Zopfochytrium polystomum]|nr:SWIRM domain-containing protein [Zopfochytrium polystomum]
MSADNDSDSEALITALIAADASENRHRPTLSRKRPAEDEDLSDSALDSIFDDGSSDGRENWPARKRKAKSSKPTAGVRWSSEELDRLKDGIARFGYGSWKIIARHVKSRDSLQCKNRARSLAIAKSSTTEPNAPKPHERFADAEGPSTTNEGAEAQGWSGGTTESREVQTPTSSTTAAQTADVREPSSLAEARPPTLSTAVLSNSTCTLSLTAPHSIEIEGVPEFFTRSKSKQKTPERYLRIRNFILTGWEKTKPAPYSKTAARRGLNGEGDVHAIARVHAFLEREGFINNITETSSRGRKEADSNEKSFNSFSFNSEVGRRARRVRNDKGEWVNINDLKDGRVIVHGEDGEPLSDQSDDDDKVDMRLLAKNAKFFADEELAKHDVNLLAIKRRQLHRKFFHYNETDVNDPFRLIPVRRYRSGNKDTKTLAPQAPFALVVNRASLIVMDFHAHLAETEIIGLLGGTYDAESRLLRVEDVFPCKSVSTGIQCEIEPESAVQAHIYFSNAGRAVVGWYHSHPTFDPNPSVRDVETQAEHQRLFKRDEDAVEPFVGAILTPWETAGAGGGTSAATQSSADPSEAGRSGALRSLQSKVTWLRVEKVPNAQSKLSHGDPFECDVQFESSDTANCVVRDKLKDLASEYRNYESRVDMTKRYGGFEPPILRLDKTLESLRCSAGHERSQSELEDLIEFVRGLFVPGRVPEG